MTLAQWDIYCSDKHKGKSIKSIKHL